MLQVGDLRMHNIIQTNIRMYLIKPRYTSEGEYLPYEIQELVINNSCRLFFMPIIITHIIDEKSPLSEMISISNKMFINKNFEIIVTLDGKIKNINFNLDLVRL